MLIQVGTDGSKDGIWCLAWTYLTNLYINLLPAGFAYTILNLAGAKFQDSWTKPFYHCKIIFIASLARGKLKPSGSLAGYQAKKSFAKQVLCSISGAHIFCKIITRKLAQNPFSTKFSQYSDEIRLPNYLIEHPIPGSQRLWCFSIHRTKKLKENQF